MLVLHAERVAVGELLTDDDFRLVIMPSAVPGGFSKGHDLLTDPEGVANRHERKGTVIGEQTTKILIVIGRDDLQVGLNKGFVRLADHFFLHRFSCFLYIYMTASFPGAVDLIQQQRRSASHRSVAVGELLLRDSDTGHEEHIGKATYSSCLVSA